MEERRTAPSGGSAPRPVVCDPLTTATRAARLLLYVQYSPLTHVLVVGNESRERSLLLWTLRESERR